MQRVTFGCAAALPASALALAASLSAPAASTPNVTSADGTSGVTGHVYSLPYRRPLSGARIEARDEHVFSQPDGSFRLELPPGTYDLRLTAAGYVSMQRVNQVVDVGFARLDFEAVPQHLQPDGLAAIARYLRRSAAASATLSAVRPDTAMQLDQAAVSEMPRSVRVLMPDGQIAEMATDEYLKGVVPHEMGYINRRAAEALKAQAVASRTYAATSCLASSAGDPDVCEPGIDANVDTTTRTQVWRPVHYDLTDALVDSTHGVGAWHAGQLIRSFFFARTDGYTASNADIWRGSPLPYLRRVASPDPFLVGRGHGVGMSQEGAAVLGDWGATYEEIIEYYYSGAKVNPPGRPELVDPVITPASGDTNTEFEFSVTYRDPDGDPPALRQVLIGEWPHELSSEGGDFRSGVVYQQRLALPAGTHPVRFRFEDGYTPRVELYGGSVEVAPALSAPVLAATWQVRMRDGSQPDGMDTAELVAISPSYRAQFDFQAVAVQLKGPRTAGWLQAFPRLRARSGSGNWSDWIRPPPSPDGRYDEPGWSDLVFVTGNQLQLGWDTVTPPNAAVAVHYLNAQQGPSAERARSTAVRSGAGPPIVPRQAWGADESLRFRDGQPIWPAEHVQPVAYIVHHTVTANSPSDPAAVIRSIYYYHAVTRGWGDIGYNFLLDETGTIYEGRAGGERPDGTIVLGGHAQRYNSGSIGVALLGTFTDPGSQPTRQARDGLTELLAWRGVRYGIWPQQRVYLVDKWFDWSVMGHRDALPGHTVCPGDGLATWLPDIRQRVDGRMRELAQQATPTPTPVPSVTPIRILSATALPTPTVSSGCGDRIVNGGFEIDNAGWQRQLAYYTGFRVRSGQRSMIVGLLNDQPDDAASEAYVSQDIFIPANARSMHLSFWAWGAGSDGDHRLVRIRSPQGQVVALQATEIRPGGGWQLFEFDLSAALLGYRGDHVQIYFGVLNNGDGAKSYLRLDDVSFTACSDSGASYTQVPGTATPSPTITRTATPPLATPTPDCRQRLVNPGFEADADRDGVPDGWRFQDTTYPPSLNREIVHTGAAALDLGSGAQPHGFGYSAARQDVQITGRVMSARLSLWYYPQSRDYGDRQVVEWQDLLDGGRVRLLGTSPPEDSGSWIHLSRQLEPSQVGDVSRVLLAVLERGQYQPGTAPRLVVDDLQLDVCLEPVSAIYLPRSQSNRE